MIIGPEYSLGADGIALEPDQVDTVSLFPKDDMISYDTDSSETPNIMVDIAKEGKPDYSFEIQGMDMQGSGAITVLLDRKTGALVCIEYGKWEGSGKSL